MAEAIVRSVRRVRPDLGFIVVSTENAYVDDPTVRWMDLAALQHATYNPEAIAACPQPLVNAMACYEIIALKCMDKLSKITNLRVATILSNHAGRSMDTSYGYRRAVYLRHLGFWDRVFDHEQVIGAVFTNIPHVSLDYVVYGLCKVREIPVLTFEDVSHFGCVIPRHCVESLPSETLAALRRPGDAPLSDFARAKIEHMSQKNCDPHPHYMSHSTFGGFSFHNYRNSLRPTARSIIRSLLAPPPEKKTHNELIRKYLKKEKFINAALTRCQTQVDLGRRYVYVPLSVQPELSTAPLAGAFVDQINLIRLLVECLPEDVAVYVKEHPAQGAISRNPEEYYEIADIPRVSLCETGVSTFTLIRNALAVATCTGTAGIEALFQGKPALFFGECAFSYAPGAHAIRTRQDCQQAIDAILAGEKPDIARLHAFVSALEGVGVRAKIAAIDDYHRNQLGLSQQDNARILSDITARWVADTQAKAKKE
ncbi:hypothetical protein [Magnetospirillum sp. 15-1]|uniref:capsular polysaccharide export protein, LipB/KpsS family n=1 Tax=Magnetospirillum sp. 15-1 TaxID=1979370 RepID=UPI00148360EA|nr:hypothetical protein [Magnetospirillum sp. 15-1]